MENIKIHNENDALIENRNAFRIDDNIQLSLHIIPDNKIEDALKTYPENNAELQLLNNFSDTSKALTDQFVLLRRRYPEVAKYLKILDDKINILAKKQFSASSIVPGLKWHQVNISAGGLRFSYDKQLQINTYLELRLQLSQISNYIMAYGKIVRCEQNNETGEHFLISVEFTHINVEDRETIHQHVRDKEIRLIREKNLV